MLVLLAEIAELTQMTVSTPRVRRELRHEPRFRKSFPSVAVNSSPPPRSAALQFRFFGHTLIIGQLLQAQQSHARGVDAQGNVVLAGECCITPAVAKIFAERSTAIEVRLSVADQ